jgi:hypothetical protein
MVLSVWITACAGSAVQPQPAPGHAVPTPASPAMATPSSTPVLVAPAEAPRQPSAAPAGEPASCEQPGDLDRFKPPVRRDWTLEVPADERQEWVKRIEESWARNQVKWLGRIGATPWTALPLSDRTLKSGDLLKVAIPKARAIIVDLAHADGDAEATVLSFARGKPRNDPMGLWGTRIAREHEHWITVFPRAGQAPATEVGIHVDRGSVRARIVSAPIDRQGRVEFPGDWALGQEPLATMMNCGPEHVYALGVSIRSAQAAIDLIKDMYLGGKAGFWNMATCRRAERPSDEDAPRRNDDIDWSRLVRRVRERSVGKRTIFEFTYTAFGCGPDSYVVRISSDGWLSHYGCCGK